LPKSLQYYLEFPDRRVGREERREDREGGKMGGLERRKDGKAGREER
jgi:hypothetical protein